jgi:hypothetical protein
MKGPLACALCAAVFGWMGNLIIDVSPAMGSTIDLSGIQNPDLAALSLTTQYTPSAGSTGTFSITGWPTSFTVSNGDIPQPITISPSGSYNLTAQINKVTGQLLSGTISIEGTIPTIPGVSSGTLLTGTLTNFGFSNGASDFFQFLVNITGGDLAHYYTGKMGIQVDANNSGFTGSFLTSFASAASDTSSDNASMTVVPEPSTAMLLLGGLACFAVATWRNRSRVHSIV